LGEEHRAYRFSDMKRVLGEHWTAQEVILVVAASRKGEPDQVHILRAPRPG